MLEMVATEILFVQAMSATPDGETFRSTLMARVYLESSTPNCSICLLQPFGTFWNLSEAFSIPAWSHRHPGPAPQ